MPLRSSCELPVLSSLASAVAHLVCLIALALVLHPAGRGKRSTLELQLGAADQSAQLDTVLLSPLPPIEKLLSDDTVMPTSEVPLQDFASEIVLAPVSSRAGGTGQDLLATSFRAQGSGMGDAGRSAEFFGSTAYGNCFVYVLDMSYSMDELGASPGEGSRFERATAELLRSLDRLTEDQQFYVVLFCYHTLKMFDDPSPTPSMLPATLESKQLFKLWLENVRTGPGTDPREGLKLALEMQPSAVFLLSDGEFNGQKHGKAGSTFRGNPSVFEIIAKANTGLAPIHTVAYENAVSKSTMESIADRTGGSFRFVPALELPPDHPNRTPRRELAAAKLLLRGNQLEQSGERSAALRIYRRAKLRYPTTAAGNKASSRMEQLRAELTQETAKN